MIYLASPYSDPDPLVCEERFLLTCQATASALHAGYVVFSPIVHAHPLLACGLPSDGAFWLELDRLYLERCDEFWLLQLDGWEESVGVQSELALARELNLPISFLRLESEEVKETPGAPATTSQYLSLQPAEDPPAAPVSNA